MLAKVSKTDLLAQLANVRRMANQAGAGVKKWRIRIARSTGSQDVVYEVQTKDGKDWLCPVDCSAEGLEAILAALTDRELEAMDMDALVDELTKSEATDVVIGWPANGTFSVVVKVLAVSKGDECITYLFPGPADIDKVNEEIREYVKTHGCRSPAHLEDCGECPRMMTCDTLRAAERLVKKRRGIKAGAEDT